MRSEFETAFLYYAGETSVKLRASGSSVAPWHGHVCGEGSAWCCTMSSCEGLHGGSTRKKRRGILEAALTVATTSYSIELTTKRR